MIVLRKSSQAAVVMTLTLLLSTAFVLAGEEGKQAKIVVSLISGGGDDDLKELRSVMARIPAIKCKTEAIELSGNRRDDKALTKFVPITLTDTSKTDVGAIAKAVASAATPSKDRVAPGLYLLIGFDAGGANDQQLRGCLENVKGVDAKHSFAGDVNLWVNVDASGQAKFSEITKAIKDVGIPVKD